MKITNLESGNTKELPNQDGNVAIDPLFSPDGSGAHPLKAAGTGVYQPIWSRDGAHILYVQNNSLWMIGANGDNPEKILGPFPDWKDQFGFYGYIRHQDSAWFRP